MSAINRRLPLHHAASSSSSPLPPPNILRTTPLPSQSSENNLSRLCVVPCFLLLILVAKFASRNEHILHMAERAITDKYRAYPLATLPGAKCNPLFKSFTGADDLCKQSADCAASRPGGAPEDVEFVPFSSYAPYLASPISASSSLRSSSAILSAECSSTHSTLPVPPADHRHHVLRFPKRYDPYFEKNTFHSFYMTSTLLCAHAHSFHPSNSGVKMTMSLPEEPANAQYLEALKTLGEVEVSSSGFAPATGATDIYTFREPSSGFEGVQTRIMGLPPFTSWSFEIERGGIPLLVGLGERLRSSLTSPSLDPPNVVILQRSPSRRYLPIASSICSTLESSHSIPCTVLSIEPSTPLSLVAAALASTTVLVGVHGAGFSHSLLLPSDSSVIEITLRGSDLWPPPDSYYHKGDYHNLALSLGLRYSVIDARAVTRGRGTKEISVRDVLVDVGEVVEEVACRFREYG